MRTTFIILILFFSSFAQSSWRNDNLFMLRYEAHNSQDQFNLMFKALKNTPALNDGQGTIGYLTDGNFNLTCTNLQWPHCTLTIKLNKPGAFAPDYRSTKNKQQAIEDGYLLKVIDESYAKEVFESLNVKETSYKYTPILDSESQKNSKTQKMLIATNFSLKCTKGKEKKSRGGRQQVKTSPYKCSIMVQPI